MRGLQNQAHGLEEKSLPPTYDSRGFLQGFFWFLFLAPRFCFCFCFCPFFCFVGVFVCDCFPYTVLTVTTGTYVQYSTVPIHAVQYLILLLYFTRLPGNVQYCTVL